MKKNLMGVAVAVALLSGCLGSGLDTTAKQGVAFCTSFASVLGKMTLFKQTGNLSAGDIQQVDTAVAIIDPYCSGPTPEAPAASVVNALDALLLIALNQGS